MSQIVTSAIDCILPLSTTIDTLERQRPSAFSKPSTMESFTMDQTLINGRFKPIPLSLIPDTALTSETISQFLASDTTKVGIAIAYSSGKLAAIAFSSKHTVLLVEFSPKTKLNDPTRALLQKELLCRDIGSYFSFNAHYVASALYADMKLYVAHLIDLQSLFPDLSSRDPLDTVKAAFGENAKLYEGNFPSIFGDESWNPKRHSQDACRLAEKAWLACHIASLGTMEMALTSAKEINTELHTKEELAVVANILRDSNQLDSIKPTSTTHDISSSTLSDRNADGTVNINFVRYQNRVRSGGQVPKSE
ncbi:hypothetical protein BD410DRAFT_607879 [Rickenella mellea]|uniref:3'-5' exonuclease domain-containing protein n=1 Tax=Rickenella mellea TaxID=50990 RepID=A0A4Y7QEF3_9AGAM|nr:hypothetical protein BD410DRAFT_607879 [Rickenella mellea]